MPSRYVRRRGVTIGGRVDFSTQGGLYRYGVAKKHDYAQKDVGPPVRRPHVPPDPAFTTCGGERWTRPFCPAKRSCELLRKIWANRSRGHPCEGRFYLYRTIYIAIPRCILAPVVQGVPNAQRGSVGALPPGCARHRV